MKKETNITLLASFLLLLPFLSIADIAPNPISAPNLKPLTPTSVQMVSEVVTVDLYKDRSTVEVLFEMKNNGETEIVEIGFPIMDYYFGWKSSLFIGQNSEGDRFKVWVDDQPVEDIKIYGFNFREVSSTESSIAHKKRDIFKEDSIRQRTYDMPVNQIPDANGRVRGVISFNGDDSSVMPWYIWKTTFPKGETRWIKVRYSLPNGATKRNNFFNYVLHTGANWDQAIGKATITVKNHDIPEDWIGSIQPEGYIKDGNTISWTFTNLEPTRKDDIFIYYYNEAIGYKKGIPMVYLDHKLLELNRVLPENITVFSVVKQDSLNYPNGAIFIYTKEFNFALLKNLVEKVSHKVYKELASLSTDDFYKNYKIVITGGDAKEGDAFNDLSTADIVDINIEYEDDKNKLVITKR